MNGKQIREQLIDKQLKFASVGWIKKYIKEEVNSVKSNFRTKTKKTELLFLELMYNLLVTSGKCAVIVPDGVLFGNSKAYKNIRQLLLEKCRLDAVSSMSSGVFKPYA